MSQSSPRAVRFSACVSRSEEHLQRKVPDIQGMVAPSLLPCLPLGGPSYDSSGRWAGRQWLRAQPNPAAAPLERLIIPTAWALRSPSQPPPSAGSRGRPARGLRQPRRAGRLGGAWRILGGNSGDTGNRALSRPSGDTPGPGGGCAEGRP